MNHTPIVWDELRNPTPNVLFRIQTLQHVKPRVERIMPKYWGCLTNPYGSEVTNPSFFFIFRWTMESTRIIRPMTRKAFSMTRNGVKNSDSAMERLTGRFVNIITKYVAKGMVIKPVQTARGGSD